MLLLLLLHLIMLRHVANQTSIFLPQTYYMYRTSTTLVLNTHSLVERFLKSVNVESEYFMLSNIEPLTVRMYPC